MEEMLELLKKYEDLYDEVKDDADDQMYPYIKIFTDSSGTVFNNEKELFEFDTKEDFIRTITPFIEILEDEYHKKINEVIKKNID